MTRSAIIATLVLALAASAIPRGPTAAEDAATSGPLAAAASAGPAAAPAAPQEEDQEDADGEQEDQEEQEAEEEEQEIRPYGEVIPADAITEEGLFRAHRVDEKLYYEIPRAELGKVHLWVSRLARAQTGTGFGGQRVSNRVVRWEERGEDHVLLRSVSYEVVADTSKPIYRAVEAATFEPVIRAFEVEAFGPDSAPVIDVTELFETDVPEFSPRRRLGASALDEERSFLESVRVFPENVEVQALLTFRSDTVPGLGTPGSVFGTPSVNTISVLMHHSMRKLPEDPMRPRLADDRVGYFELRQYDYGREEQEAPRRRYITRWRLEKRDPAAELSEPVEPIVFYIDRATPDRWRPWIKRGVESWQTAFEEAGFRNAVLARDPPSAAEDPEWHPGDARYPMIRWLPSPVENAFGPHIHDPRTGEILDSQVQMHHNVMNLLRNWYFVQVAPLDDRTAQLPLPDSLMGRLVAYVAAHEVGHALGFPHNMKASSSYPVDSLRSASFTEEYGNQASIMDYGRFNYVAQPGDGARLIPMVGPYDRFAVMWGYRPIPGAASPDEERADLDRWARRQDEDPMLRYGRADGIDPGAQTEAMGDDPVAATRYGLANLRRVVPMLLPAAGRDGDSYDELEELYESLMQQWAREMGHVVAVVGGVDRQTKHYGQEGVVHTPVSRDRQREAVEFLIENGFETPDYLIEPEVLRRIEPSGTVSRIRILQQRLLRDLLSDVRLRRLIEQEAVGAVGNEGEPYDLAEMLGHVREGVWSEIYGDGDPRIDAYRRNLQREHVHILSGKLNGRSDIRPMARGELRELRERIAERVDDAGDRATRLHLADLRFQIERALDPR